MEELTDGATSQLGQLNSLLKRAEALKNVKSHPGETQEFMEWSTELENFIASNCGHRSQSWLQYANIPYFPRWYNPDEHGPIRFPESKNGAPTAVVLSDAQENDRRRAFEMYQNGITKAAAIIKSLMTHIRTTGAMIEPENGEDMKSSPLVQVNPTFHNSQSQSQQQSMTLEQSMARTLEVIKEHYGEDQTRQAAKKLEELKKDKSWDKVQAVIKWFMDLGRAAFIALLPTLAKILIPAG